MLGTLLKISRWIKLAILTIVTVEVEVNLWLFRQSVLHLSLHRGVVLKVTPIIVRLLENVDHSLCFFSRRFIVRARLPNASLKITTF